MTKKIKNEHIYPLKWTGKDGVRRYQRGISREKQIADALFVAHYTAALYGVEKDMVAATEQLFSQNCYHLAKMHIAQVEKLDVN